MYERESRLTTKKAILISALTLGGCLSIPVCALAVDRLRGDGSLKLVYAGIIPQERTVYILLSPDGISQQEIDYVIDTTEFQLPGCHIRNVSTFVEEEKPLENNYLIDCKLR